MLRRGTRKAKGAADAGGPKRRRLPRQERYRQLIDVAWRIVRESGTDALTLGVLAEEAGVAKPVVYDHFATRNRLLAALYGEFDKQQNALIDAAIEASEPTLASRASVIAGSYVDCVLAQGRELPGVSSALAGSRELEGIKRESETAFLQKCRALLAPFAPGKDVGVAGLRAMLGAAEALSYAAAVDEISASEAKQELRETIVEMVSRQGRAGSRRRAAA
ncbi:TetR/AcrR family transcriptional regulator [Variovorax sp. DT-64]|uniref:TetR/AcrR family transcriptional regulator n=1 Tax=Variovorax sp. DT-64 TaxID=3396160 RepID=UPI003F1A1FF8